jgi:glyoxylase-like metal-dependent hydrolase (beta-lactamase superfamily II)
VTTGNEKSATSKNEQRDYLFEQVQVPRGCLGYIIADTETRLAAIVDPELEMVEPMIDLVFKHGLRVAYVIDSHTHADHVSGARDLKSKTIAKLVMHEEAPSGAVDIRIKDGDRLHLGSLPLKFLHTPGHAKDLVSILLPGRILTADAFLIGSCGRTDLLNGSAIRQYHTLYHTYKSLPDELEVWPCHDYKGRSSSTLGDEKRNNPKMLFDSEEEFVEFMDLENPKRLDPVEHLAEALKANMK